MINRQPKLISLELRVEKIEIKNFTVNSNASVEC